MPYIKSNDGRREALQKRDSATTAGELNYQIFHYTKDTLINNKAFSSDRIKTFVKNFLGYKPNYQRYNDMVGCLILCAKEVKRRLSIDLIDNFKYIIDSYDFEIADYEDKKIKENGDV